MLKKYYLCFLKLTKNNFVRREIGGRVCDLEYDNFIHQRAIQVFPKRELEFCKEIEARIGSVDTFIDVGSNIGLYLMNMSKFDVKVVGVDPDETNIKISRSNSKKYFPDRHIEHYCLAIGNDNRVMNVDFSNSGTGSSRIVQSNSEISNSIDISTLDSFILEKSNESQKIGLIIDIEGFEWDVISVFQNSEKKVHWIGVELHQNLLRRYSNVTLLDFIEQMKKIGYRLTWLRVPEKGDNQHGQTHAIFEIT